LGGNGWSIFEALKDFPYYIGSLVFIKKYGLFSANFVQYAYRQLGLNSFGGSHAGAKRSALIYSLACSCRLNGINSFDYFNDLLKKMLNVYPNTDKEYIRNLLPDRLGK